MQTKLLRSFVPAAVQPVKLQQRTEGEMPLITGYGAVFYRAGQEGTQYWLLDNIVERIAPGAFTRAIAEDDIRGLKNHDPNLLLGRNTAGTMKLFVDEVGLRYEIAPPNTQTGRDTVEEVRRGDLTGSSFSFIIPEGGDEWSEQKTAEGAKIRIRTLNELQVFDLGPVTFPAYSATTTGIRCYRSVTKEDEELFLRLDAPKAEVASRSMVDLRCREIEMRIGRRQK